MKIKILRYIGAFLIGLGLATTHLQGMGIMLFRTTTIMTGLIFMFKLNEEENKK